MHTYLAELHVHTVLSPCADVEMIPPLIVQEAVQRGIRLIAITDHNASANVKAVQKAAAGRNLVVLPGMELQTREEVHLLCLFDSTDQLDIWQQEVDRLLPDIANRPEYFGEQFIVDETGEFLRREPRLLLTSANLSLEDAVKDVTRLGGMVIPAHVDRKVFGMIANLGFIPADVDLPALEISQSLDIDLACQVFPQLAGYPLIQSGDVHHLADFLGVTELQIERPIISEIRLALAGQAGRRLRIIRNRGQKVDKTPHFT